MTEKHLTVKDLLGKDLAGYQLVQAFYHEVKTGLMGFFPAIYDDGTREMVLCYDFEVLEEVGKLLQHFPNERYDVGSILCLAKPNDADPHCISLAARVPLDGARSRLLTRDGFTRLVKQHPKGKPFIWRP